MAYLLMILLITILVHFLLTKLLKRLKKDYLLFKECRGIDEEYNAWRDLFLRAIFKNLLVFLIVLLLIICILERW